MKPYAVAFHRWSKYTNARFLKIWKGSNDLSYAWSKAKKQEFVSWGIEEDIVETLIRERQDINVTQEWERIEKVGITVITINDEIYPILLHEIADFPPILYVRGDVSVFHQSCFAVVGTRLMSAYGKQVMDYIVPALVQAGLVIVSGLALGVDAYAHKLTLDSKGKTIAVLGSGVDVVYPVENKRLGENIIMQGGMVISELPLGTHPTNYSFPIRNRIISGLSKGTLVVEAKEESGSLITARLALEQNREVFAAPGNIFASNTGGTHNLIKAGEAKLVTKVEDILTELGFVVGTGEKESNMENIYFNDPKEETVFSLLTREPKMVDVIIQESNLSSSEVHAILTIFEVKGLAQNVGGMMWVRR